MIITFIIINFILTLSCLVSWIVESRRRRTAEDHIFFDLNEELKLRKDTLKINSDVLEAHKFLVKRSKFHRQLIDAQKERMDSQEQHFGQFGSFISETSRTMDIKSKTIKLMTERAKKIPNPKKTNDKS